MPSLLALTFAQLSGAFAPHSAAAAPPTTPPVRAIVIRGNTRSQTYVIRNEIETRIGDAYSGSIWNADVQRVRDLGIFWTTAATAETGADGMRLFLDVEEKWTLIPLFGFNRTRDVTEWSGGLYEANFLGRNTRAAFEFSRKRGGNTYQLFHEANRVGRSALYYQIELRKTDELLTVYNQENRDRAEPVGFYEARSTLVFSEVGVRLDSSGIDTLGLYGESRDTRYDLLGNTPEQRRANSFFAFEAPPLRMSHRLGLHLKAGKLHYQDYLFRGRSVHVFAAGAYQVRGVPRIFSRVSADYRRFWIPFRRHNVGLRLYATSTDSPRLEDRATLGGLSEIRGFPDERFSGRHAGLANLEYRYPALDNRYVLTQATAFADAGTAFSGGVLSRDILEKTAASGGIGVRLVVKPIISMMVRFDYAWTVLPYRSRGFALGITQFF